MQRLTERAPSISPKGGINRLYDRNQILPMRVETDGYNTIVPCKKAASRKFVSAVVLVLWLPGVVTRAY